jgi:hypothetical protein
MTVPRKTTFRASATSATDSGGFDEITKGGLPGGRTAILVGGPGCSHPSQESLVNQGSRT